MHAQALWAALFPKVRPRGYLKDQLFPLQQPQLFNWVCCLNSLRANAPVICSLYYFSARLFFTLLKFFVIAITRICFFLFINGGHLILFSVSYIIFCWLFVNSIKGWKSSVYFSKKWEMDLLQQVNCSWKKLEMEYSSSLLTDLARSKGKVSIL